MSLEEIFTKITNLSKSIDAAESSYQLPLNRSSVFKHNLEEATNKSSGNSFNEDQILPIIVTNQMRESIQIFKNAAIKKEKYLVKKNSSKKFSTNKKRFNSLQQNLDSSDISTDDETSNSFAYNQSTQELLKQATNDENNNLRLDETMNDVTNAKKPSDEVDLSATYNTNELTSLLSATMADRDVTMTEEEMTSEEREAARKKSLMRNVDEITVKSNSGASGVIVAAAADDEEEEEEEECVDDGNSTSGDVEDTNVIQEDVQDTKLVAEEAQDTNVVAEEDAEDINSCPEDVEDVDSAVEDTQDTNPGVEVAQNINTSPKDDEDTKAAQEDAEDTNVGSGEDEDIYPCPEDAEDVDLAADDVEDTKAAQEDIQDINPGAKDAEDTNVGSGEDEDIYPCPEDAEDVDLAADDVEDTKAAQEDIQDINPGAKDAEDTNVGSGEDEDIYPCPEDAEDVDLAADDVEGTNVDPEDVEDTNPCPEDVEDTDLAVEDAEDTNPCPEDAEDVDLAVEDAEDTNLTLKDCQNLSIKELRSPKDEDLVIDLKTEISPYMGGKRFVEYNQQFCLNSQLIGQNQQIVEIDDNQLQTSDLCETVEVTFSKPKEEKNYLENELERFEKEESTNHNQANYYCNYKPLPTWQDYRNDSNLTSSGYLTPTTSERFYTLTKGLRPLPKLSSPLTGRDLYNSNLSTASCSYYNDDNQRNLNEFETTTSLDTEQLLLDLQKKQQLELEELQLLHQEQIEQFKKNLDSKTPWPSLRVSISNAADKVDDNYLIWNKFSALIKGHLTRKLLYSKPTTMLMQCIRDTSRTLLSLQEDKMKNKEDQIFIERLYTQVRSALYDFHDIFFKTTIKEKMEIIRNSHHYEVKENISPKVVIPKLSKATQKSLERKRSKRMIKTSTSSSSSSSRTTPIPSSSNSFKQVKSKISHMWKNDSKSRKNRSNTKVLSTRRANL